MSSIFLQSPAIYSSFSALSSPKRFKTSIFKPLFLSSSLTKSINSNDFKCFCLLFLFTRLVNSLSLVKIRARGANRQCCIWSRSSTFRFGRKTRLAVSQNSICSCCIFPRFLSGLLLFVTLTRKIRLLLARICLWHPRSITKLRRVVSGLRSKTFLSYWPISRKVMHAGN